jgi:hypothetical protein
MSPTTPVPPDAEVYLIPMFPDTISIIPCPKATVAVVEHNFIAKARFVCPENVL